MNHNDWTLVGRLAADVELKYTPQGKAVATIRIAVNHGPSGTDQQVDFFNVVTWEKAAEFVANYATKGRLLLCQGPARNRTYTRKDGTTGYAFEMVARTVRLMDKRPNQGDGKTEEYHDAD